MTELPNLPARRTEARLSSEEIVISAPMSFAGAAERAWKLTRREPKWGWAIFAVFVIAVWWSLVVGWYLFFGLLLIPYRLIRRGQRKRRMEGQRHRELMNSVEKR